MPQHSERLAEVGSVDSRTGFPFWYEDSTGLRLELVRASGDDHAPLVIDPGESGPLRDFAAVPAEAFCLLAETELEAGAGTRTTPIRVILALEATFATEGVLSGVDAPPPVITAESAAGGSSTRSVKVVG